MATCTSCGAAVSDGVKFCTVCGTSVAPASQAPASPAPPQQNPSIPPASVYPQPYPAPASAPVPALPVDVCPAKSSIYAPIGTWGYIGYFILFAIPIIGQILLIAFAFSKKGNVNRRALARAMFVFLVIALVIGIVSGILMATVFKGVEGEIASETGGGIFSWLQGLNDGDSDDSDPPYREPGEDGEDAAAQRTEVPGQNSGNQNTQAPDPGEYNFGEGTIFTAQWPDNQFTRQVPKPGFDVSFGSVSDTEYTALGGGATIEQLRDYAKKLQKAGFNKNAETTDESVFGMATYTFKADNGKGYEVEINYVSMMNINSIAIRKR